MFKKISEAYSVLSNPTRRKKYDLYGETEEDGDMFAGMDDLFNMFSGADDLDDFDDFIKILE